MADAGGGNWNGAGAMGATDREVLAAPAAAGAAHARDAAAAPLPAAGGPAGLTVARRYTEPGVHPFDRVEWDVRDAVIANEKGETVFEQHEVEVPKAWSQTATNVVVSKYFRGQLDTPERETSVRQLISRVADRIADWGREGGYFSTEADAEAFHAELVHILLHQYACFNSPVWFNVGIEEHPAVLGVLHQLRRGHDAVHPRARQDGGDALQVRLRHRQQPLGAPFLGRDPGRRGHGLRPGVVHARLRRVRRRDQERRQDQARREDGHPGRRPPRHRRVHPLQGSRGAQGLGADRGRLRRGLQRRRRRLRLDLLPEREPLRARHRRVHAGGGRGPRVDDDRRDRRPADGHAAGGGAAGHDGRVDLGVRRSGHAVRQHDQPLAHLSEHGPDQRQQPVQRVHVPGRHRLQPGVAQPDALLRPGHGVRHRVVPAHLRDRHHRAGDHRRQRELPDAEDRGELARLPAARHRLRESRRPADGAGPALRLGGRPRLRRCGDRPDVGCVLPAVDPDRRDQGSRSRATRRTASRCCRSCATTGRR